MTILFYISMEKHLLGRKIGMTQHFDAAGRLVAGTVILVEPNTVIRQNDRTMLAISKEGKAAKPQNYIKEKVGSQRGVFVREASTLSTDKEKIDVTVFDIGDEVKVTGITKGKGFAGTIKRHNFHRGPVSHGSHNVRQPGSIGAQQPQHVVRGKKMSGHMGHENITVRGGKILAVEADKMLLVVSGNVPGPKRGFIEVEVV